MLKDKTDLFAAKLRSFLIGQVFAFGVLFGWARWATGSTFLTMMLHAVVNLEGMLETFFSLNS